MNDKLKTTAAEVAHALKAVTEVERKAADASRERDALRAEIEGLDAAVEAAEQDHAAALAAIQLGEGESADDTSIKLMAARDAAKARPELAMRLRVAESVVTSLEARHRDAVARYTAATEAAKAARVAELEARAREAYQAAKDSVVIVSTRMAELLAVARALEANGGRWSLGTFDPVLALSTAHPDKAAVELMAASLSRELEAA